LLVSGPGSHREKEEEGSDFLDGDLLGRGGLRLGLLLRTFWIMRGEAEWRDGTGQKECSETLKNGIEMSIDLDSAII